MNDEIKIILDYLKDDKWDYYPSDGIPYKVFLMEERDKLLDYITNLQKENEELKEQKKNVIEYIKNHQPVFSMWNKKQISKWFDEEFYKELLDILYGGDEE